MSRLHFHLDAQAPGSQARAGRFTTLHGEVTTPVFMPVGTQATVRNQTFDTLKSSGSSVLLANTYHLLRKPGLEVFRKLGGIHRFMNWNGSVLTDSGGFQIFSLSHARTIDDEGVTFRPHPDAAPLQLTPELSIEVQRAIGSDIMMAFDQCVPSTSTRAVAEEAVTRTFAWAQRSLHARQDSAQALFGIVQGACFEDLRRRSADQLTSLPFDGFAIGGLAVGETRKEREDFTELTASLLPPDRLRYLMGVGTPIDLLEGVHRGVDMFDCILPVSLAQQGVGFTARGRLDLRRTVYQLADEPLDHSCRCDTCALHSRAYLHHLIKAAEPLGWQLIGAHNLHFYQQLMREMREQIVGGTFAAYYREARQRLVARDEENPPGARPSVRRKKTRHPLELGAFTIVDSPGGFSSIRHRISGEPIHSVWDSLERITRLERRLLQAGPELVIWDVGMGAAANAMAVIRCYQEADPEKVRPLKLISFEHDLDSLKLALEHPLRFPHLNHGAPRALLRDSRWKQGNLSWELVQGNFFEYFAKAPGPDLILYNPLSARTESPLWTPECLDRFRALTDSAIEPDDELLELTPQFCDVPGGPARSPERDPGTADTA